MKKIEFWISALIVKWNELEMGNGKNYKMVEMQIHFRHLGTEIKDQMHKWNVKRLNPVICNCLPFKGFA